MRNILAYYGLLALAGCANPPDQATLQADGAKALYFLQAAGCVTQAAAAAATPVVQAQADAQGNAVLSLVGATAGKACSITVPAAAVASAAPAKAS